MPAFGFLVASALKGWQTALIIIAVLLIAGLVALNVYCALKFRIVTERKLFDDELQSQRDALDAKLKTLYTGERKEPAAATDTDAAPEAGAAEVDPAAAEKIMDIARNSSRYYKD